MIGDKLTYHSVYKDIIRFIISELENALISKKRICISVGGESGCGKTSLAYSLKIDIEKAIGLKGFIFHLDDYFKLPPADNHNARLKDTSLVGMNEVNIELLDSHLIQFKEKGGVLNKPLVDYPQNKILNEQIPYNEYDFCIVEGTYVSVLKAPDYRIFMEITYLDTKRLRIERGRDLMNDSNEHILELEHQIIKPQCEFAHIVIDNKLNVITKK